MAGFSFSQNDLANCQRWFKYIFLPFAKGIGNSDYLQDSYKKQVVADHCKQLLIVITDRQFDMNINGPTDRAITYLAGIGYRCPQSDVVGYTAFTVQGDLIPHFLANICLTNHIFWDDGPRSKYEVDYFRKTILGKALWENNCFVSQQVALLNAKPETKAQTQTQTQTQTQPSNNNQQPQQTATKSSGSGKTLNINNCGGLVSKDLIKFGSDEKIAFICGDWVDTKKKTTPRIFVAPEGMFGSPLRVKLGSGQGYNDCVLYFKEIGAANTFLSLCKEHCPATVKNLDLRKKTVDAKGYYKVKTEYGEAYIQASRLE